VRLGFLFPGAARHTLSTQQLSQCTLSNGHALGAPAKWHSIGTPRLYDSANGLTVFGSSSVRADAGEIHLGPGLEYLIQ
jgi:hypothetical protein